MSASIDMSYDEAVAYIEKLQDEVVDKLEEIQRLRDEVKKLKARSDSILVIDGKDNHISVAVSKYITDLEVQIKELKKDS